MKKVFSLLLAVLMLVSALPVAYAAGTNDYTAGTAVVYTAANNEDYSITVPASLAPGSSGTVTLAGTWAPNTTISVTADTSVKLTNSINANDQKTLAVKFNGISEAGSNTSSQTFTAPVSVDPIENAIFGTWDGHFYYYVGTKTQVSTDAPTLEGDGQTFYTLAPSTLSFRSTAPMDEFQEVQVNGVTIDSSNYTLTEGSTIVTLSIDYLQTLDVTEHEITVVSDSGSPSAGFEVVDPDLNEHGFYYNQPYCAYVDLNMVVDKDLGFILHEDGTASCIELQEAILLPATVTREDDTYTIALSNYAEVTGYFSEDGKTFIGTEAFASGDGIMDDYTGEGVDFALNNEMAVADEDYLYIINYSHFDGDTPYYVSPIDNTKSSYRPIRADIMNVPVKGISLNAFQNNTNLTTLPTMPQSIEVIGNSAFAGCTGLTNVALPDSMTYILISAFEGCTNLTSINIPYGVTDIYGHAFKDCTNLESVTIPNSVTFIDNAFSGCTSLATINYAGTVEQWNAISLGTGWNYNVPATEVICSDGTVEI